MKKIITITLVLLTLVLCHNSNAQGRFTAIIGSSVPLMDFGSGDLGNVNAGGAEVGICTGLRYIHPFRGTGFGIYGSIDLSYNGLQRSVKDDIVDLYEEMGIIIVTIDYYKYLNIPLSVGLTYKITAGENVDLFLNTGMAYNLLKMTEMQFRADGRIFTTTMDLARNVGMKTGIGLLLNKNISFSVEYLCLGTHRIEGKLRTPGFYEDIKVDGKIDLMTFTMGYMF